MEKILKNHNKKNKFVVLHNQALKAGCLPPEPGRSTLYLSTSVLKSTICKVLGMFSSTFLGNLQYLYLSTFQMYFDFQVLLEYI